MIRSLYYDWDTKPITVDEWMCLFEKQNRMVEETELPWGGRVSTVYLGLDHGSVFGGANPLIFETMVFGKDSLDDLDMDRYTTLEEAKAGHKAMVEKWQVQHE